MQQLPPRPLTRAQFCAAENMSLSTFHKLKRAGNAPAEEYFPGTSIIRISPKAIRAWHAKMEAWRDSADAKLEQERRIARLVLREIEERLLFLENVGVG